MRAGLGIEEIDINPLMVGAEGEGAVALDALIVAGTAMGAPVGNEQDRQEENMQ
jgi:hypothetical protein